MKKLAIIALCVCFLSGCIVKSEGERVGTISKFSKKGLISSTWEGEAILGGSGASGNKENTWYFSVEDEGLVNKVQELHRTGKQVVLKYKQELMVGAWRADTNYFVTDIELAKN